MIRLLCAGIVCLLAQACSISSAQTHPRTSHALLIGISDYSGSNGVSSLMGPPNDIALVRDLLKERFGVPDRNITTLLEKQATHSAIQKAFADLAAGVNEGDFVYIHYSGHGSTRPDKNERGGYDQTWVTYGSRNEKFQDLDSRDVLDKEINLWLQLIYKKARTAASEKKAPIDIVFVSDSCHSGTVARRINNDRVTNVREVKPDPAFYPQIISAENSSSLPGVRIGAARDTESAIELDPRNGQTCKDPKNCYGVFTWHWVKALRQAKPGERWEDAFKRTFTWVTADRYSAQRPQQEGHAERPIFGGDFPAPSPTVAVTHVDNTKGTIRLGAGAASGVSKGSVYHLYLAGDSSQRDVAELEVTDVSEAATSEAKLRRGEVQVGDLVTEVNHAYQFNPTRVYVSSDFAELDEILIQDMQAIIKGLAAFQLVGDQAQAELLIHILHPKKDVDGQYSYDQPSRQRLPQSFREQPPEIWIITPEDHLLHDNMRIPFSDKQQGMRVLRKNLTVLAWAQEVRRLNATGGVPKVRVELSVLRPDATCGSECFFSPKDKTPHRKIATYELNDAQVAVRRGDSITVAIQNQDSDRSWYVYLLNIAPDGRVLRIYPMRYDIKEAAKLKGEARVDLTKERWLRFNDLGVETIKLIAARDEIDVRLLENEEGYEKKEVLNQLERLLKAASRRRGGGDAKVEDWGTLQADYEVLAE